MKNYYKTRNDLMTSSLEDKLDTMLYINAKQCEASLKNLMRSKDKNININDIKERNVEIGPLVSGEAFFHEVDQYYDVVGFLVKSECEYKGNRIVTYGFRSIYFGKCHEYAPVDFDDGHSLEPVGKIGNGLGDFVEILDVLKTDEEIKKCIKENNIDINKYLKDCNMLLAEKRFFKKEKSHSSMEV